MIFSLNALLPWSRRIGADRLLRQRDVLVTDGTSDLILTSGNNVQVQSLSIDGSFVLQNGGATNSPAYTVTQDVTTLTLDPIPVAGLQAICVYFSSNYADSDILSYIVDSTNGLIADFGLRNWQMNLGDPTNPQVNDPCDAPWGIPVAEQMDMPLQKLIAIRSALSMLSDNANQNANDAILIKDGDTTIDTSKTSAGSERAVKRMQADYDTAFRLVVANRASGVIIQNNWVPLPYPWSTPYMLPGDVNGPAY